jgi:hypothetical protein
VHASPRAFWRKSSHSGDGNNCVELARIPAGVGVRDSKNPTDGVLHLQPGAWRVLADKVKAGELDL